MKEYKRVEWIDMIKGFGIILVMLGHATFPDPIKAEIYTFHMPLFFFVSGYVFSIKKYSDFRTFLVHKLKTLILPLMVFSSFITIIYAIVDIMKKISYKNVISNLLLNSFATIFQIRGVGRSVLWFIGCMFFCQILFYLILKIFKENNWKILISINSSLFIIGVIYIILINVNLPYSIDVSLIAVLFFGLGYLLKKHFEKIKSYFKVKYITIYLIINIIFGLLNFNTISLNIDMYRNRYGNYCFFLISAISGIFMCISFFKNIKEVPIISYIGKNSLIYYSFHYIIFNLLDFIIPKSLFVTNIIGEFFIGIIYVILTSGILYIVSEIINKKLSFILGKPRSLVQ